MKKFICTILAVLISITSVMFAFSWLNNSKKSANAQNFKESDLTNKEYIVDPENLSGNLASDSVKNESLFDYENKVIRPGSVVFPKTIDKLHNVNSSYIVQEFNILQNESIYMWIFIPDEYTYELVVSFSATNNKTLSWELSPNVLSSMIQFNNNDCAFGWKLFEFSLNDAEMSDGLESVLESSNFTTMKIAYTHKAPVYQEGNKNELAFYGAYKAKKYSESTSIVQIQNYVVYKINESFANGDDYFVDDEIIFSNMKDVFEYIIVGQVNLYEKSNSNYKTAITVTDSNDKTFDKTFGEKFVFENYGTHKIEIFILEYRESKFETVLYLPFSFYVDYFVMGSFTNVDYIVKTGQTKIITFNISKYFEKTGTIIAYVSDKNKADATYYLKDGVFYVEITGKKDGKISVTVEAQGKKIGSNEILNYSCSTAVQIKHEEKSASEVFLIVVLCFYGAGFITFLVISLVKARRVSVK